MIKKIMIGFGVLIGLVVVAMITIPFFIDADKMFRPRIVQAVEQNMNADLDLGRLSLSLWGGLHVQIDKFVLSEKGSQGRRPIVSMNNATLEIPISSVFSGKPDITLAVKNPEINVVSGQDGKMNVTKIAKPAEGAPPPVQQKQPEKKSGGGGINLPFELSFRIENGKFAFADLRKNTKTELKNFNLDLKRFTLNDLFKFSFSSDLDVKEMKELVLRGPIKLQGNAGIYMAGGALQKIDLDADFDMTGLLIKYVGLLNKSATSPLKIDVALTMTDKRLNIKKGHLQIGDAAVNATGTVNDFENPVVEMTIASTKFIFEHWRDTIAPLKDFDMSGSANFDIKVSGPVSKLAFHGNASLEDVGLRAPGIVPRVTDMRAKLSFSNDTAAVSNAGVKMGNSDIEMDGSIKNFAKPVIVLNVKSQMMDVDSLLPQKTPEQEKAEADAAKKQAAGGGGGAGGGAQSVDMEKSVSGPIVAMKKNPTARALDFTGRLKMAKIRVHKAELTDLDTEMTFKDLVMALKKANAKAFGGSMGFNASIDFRGADPAYSAGGDVSGLDVNSAITSQMPAMKDSVFGKLFAKFNVGGTGVSKAKVTQSLKGNGNFKLEQGTWSALKAMQQVGDKLKSIPGAKDKIGGVNITGKFRQLRSDFNIAGGRFNIVNMIADMDEANTTVTGAGFVDFDMNLSLAGKVTTPAGGDLPNELRSSDGRLALPYELACQATAPCLKWDKTGQVVASAYLKKEGGAAVKKLIQQNSDKIDNPQVKDLLKKLPF